MGPFTQPPPIPPFPAGTLLKATRAGETDENAALLELSSDLYMLLESFVMEIAYGKRVPAKKHCPSLRVRDGMMACQEGHPHHDAWKIINDFAASHYGLELYICNGSWATKAYINVRAVGEDV